MFFQLPVDKVRPEGRLVLRATLVLTHRFVGLAIAAFLFIAGITGSILAFQQEVDAALNPDLFYRQSTGDGDPLTPSALIDRVENMNPAVNVTTIFFPVAPEASTRLGVSVRRDERGAVQSLPYDQMFVDPANARLLGTRQFGECCFERRNLIPFLWNLHFSLALPNLWGRWLMGGVAILWIFDSFVGFALTLPSRTADKRKGGTLARWRTAWTIKRGARAYRFALDLHRAGGLWLWGFLLLLGITSVALNLTNEVARPLVSTFSLPTPTIFEMRTAKSPSDRLIMSWDDAVEIGRTEAQRRSWTSPLRSMFHSQDSGIYGIRFHNAQGPNAGAKWLYIDDSSGALLDVRGPGQGSIGDRILDIQLSLHGGSIIGLPGRIVIAATGLGVAMLSMTGTIIWWKKRAPRVARLRAHRKAAVNAEE